jgi:hypothetical protein
MLRESDEYQADRRNHLRRARARVGRGAGRLEMFEAVIADLGLTDELTRRTAERRAATARWLHTLDEAEADRRNIGRLWRQVVK